MYGPLWSTMIHYCPLWSTMVHYGPLWSTMVHWSTMAHYGPLRSNTVLYGPLGSTMIHKFKKDHSLQVKCKWAQQPHWQAMAMAYPWSTKVQYGPLGSTRVHKFKKKSFFAGQMQMGSAAPLAGYGYVPLCSTRVHYVH